jgi:hypothetical protein
MRIRSAVVRIAEYFSFALIDISGLVENSEKENSEREKFWKKMEKGK